MAKKRKTVKKSMKSPKPVVSKQVGEGKVSVTMGVTVSHNYQSQKFEAGITIPCTPGKEGNALEEALLKCNSFWTDHNNTVLVNLADDCLAQKERKNRRSS